MARPSGLVSALLLVALLPLGACVKLFNFTGQLKTLRFDGAIGPFSMYFGSADNLPTNHAMFICIVDEECEHWRVSQNGQSAKFTFEGSMGELSSPSAVLWNPYSDAISKVVSSNPNSNVDLYGGQPRMSTCYPTMSSSAKPLNVAVTGQDSRLVIHCVTAASVRMTASGGCCMGAQHLWTNSLRVDLSAERATYSFWSEGVYNAAPHPKEFTVTMSGAHTLVYIDSVNSGPIRVAGNATGQNATIYMLRWGNDPTDGVVWTGDPNKKPKIIVTKLTQPSRIGSTGGGRRLLQGSEGETGATAAFQQAVTAALAAAGQEPDNLKASGPEVGASGGGIRAQQLARLKALMAANPPCSGWAQ